MKAKAEKLLRYLRFYEAQERELWRLPAVPASDRFQATALRALTEEKLAELWDEVTP